MRDAARRPESHDRKPDNASDMIGDTVSPMYLVLGHQAIEPHHKQGQPELTGYHGSCKRLAGAWRSNQEQFLSRSHLHDCEQDIFVIVCLSLESPEKVDEMVRKTVAAGGTTYSEPKDYGFMWQHGFQDLDRHIWELIYMEPSALSQG